MRLCVRAVLVEDGFVLVHQTKRGPRLYGGKVERGESPQNALVREIDEELQLRVDVGPLVAAWRSRKGLELAFQVHPIQPVGRSLKHPRMCWMPAGMLPSVLLPGRGERVVYTTLDDRDGLERLHIRERLRMVG